MVILLAGCGGGSNIQSQDSGPDSVPAAGYSAAREDSGLLKIHYIDVGQGDCILIQLPDGQNMLIDAGERDQSENVLNYIHSIGIGKLDIVIGTHPHSDHIGGIIKIIDNMPVNKVYLPRVTHTSTTFEDLLQAIKSKGLKISTAKAGVEIPLKNVKAEFMAPVGDSYEDLNNYSAVVKLEYGQSTFLFTGDAEKLSEKEMLENGTALKADVLKIGHHGSTSSTGNKFLNAVSPSCAVIMCGTDNDYGHPHKETLTKLTKAGITTYRTDEEGTILITTDGNTINVITGNKADKVESAANAASDINVDKNTNSNINYIGNKNSKKFHRPDCSNLPAEYNRIYFNSREDAVKEGYTPCGNCKP